MNDESEARNSTWGVIAGVAGMALLMFYVIHSGALAGGNRSCSTCRQPAGASQNIGNSGTAPAVFR